MKTTVKRLAVFLAIGAMPVLCFCTGAEADTLTNAAKHTSGLDDGSTNGTPTGTFTNLEEHTDNFQNFKFSDQGGLNLTRGVNPLGMLRSLQSTQEVVETTPDGTKYTGQVIGHTPNGQGTVTSPMGTNQHGEWRDGLEYRIQGTWVGPDGTREVGTWNRDGTKSGGTITWKDGRQYTGDWKVVNGAPDLPDGTGKMTWPDGRKYEGQFRDGKIDGIGRMTHPNGKIEDGLWKQDKFAGIAY